MSYPTPVPKTPVSISLKEYKNCHEVLRKIADLTAQFKQEFKKLPSISQLVYSLQGNTDENNHWLSVWVDNHNEVNNKEILWFKNILKTQPL